MKKITVNSQVVVREPQLHGNCSELKCGLAVAVASDRITVQFPGDFSPRDYPVDKVSLAEGALGDGINVENPYEAPIVKLYR